MSIKLAGMIEEIKDRLTDQEYKDILDEMKIIFHKIPEAPTEPVEVDDGIYVPPGADTDSDDDYIDNDNIDELLAYGAFDMDEIIIITCRIHGDFRETPNRHLQGHGCPTCDA